MVRFREANNAAVIRMTAKMTACIVWWKGVPLCSEGGEEVCELAVGVRCRMCETVQVRRKWEETPTSSGQAGKRANGQAGHGRVSKARRSVGHFGRM